MYANTRTMSAIDVYTQQQRDRLESIRQATERERLLLRERAGEDGQGGLMGSPNRMIRKDGTDEYSLLAKERCDIRARAEEQGDILGKIRQEEHMISSEEINVDRRLAKAEERKMELLAKLSLLQFRETDIKKREEVLDMKETSLKQKEETIRHSQRDISQQQSCIKTEIAQRNAQFVAAQKKAQDKVNEEVKLSSRLKQQNSDAEKRIMNLEMQINIKIRALDDLDREVMRDEMRQRDEEMQAIDHLRRDIENMKLTSDAEMQSFN
eukprot:Tbor_TRINITY_DN5047_c0_g1::TRINITY_DN5047_c0_g1_i1::g.14044::m.14044